VITRGIVSLIYPPRCQGCGNSLDLLDGNVLCGDCLSGIKLNTPPFCKRCGRPGVHQGGICGDCHKFKYYFDAGYAVSVYDGIMRECIHKFKYRNGVALERLFKGLMGGFAERHIEMQRYDLLAPVPLHSVKQRERTFNQSEILSLHLSRKFGVPTLKNNLVRIRQGRPLMMLSKKNRLEDISGAFTVKDASLLKDRSVLLIDDVFTTGATANECSKVLKEAGAGPVEVFTLARGE